MRTSDAQRNTLKWQIVSTYVCFLLLADCCIRNNKFNPLFRSREPNDTHYDGFLLKCEGPFFSQLIVAFETPNLIQESENSSFFVSIYIKYNKVVLETLVQPSIKHLLLCPKSNHFFSVFFNISISF